MSKEQLKQELLCEAQHEAHMAFLTKKQMSYLKETKHHYSNDYSLKNIKPKWIS